MGFLIYVWKREILISTPDDLKNAKMQSAIYLENGRGYPDLRSHGALKIQDGAVEGSIGIDYAELFYLVRNIQC